MITCYLPSLPPLSHLRHGECPQKNFLWVPLRSDRFPWYQTPPKRNNNASGLGRAIINKQIKDSRERHESGLVSWYSPETVEPVHLRPRYPSVYDRCR